MNERRRRLDLGALFFGAILLFVGGYYLLTNTFGIDLPELDWDRFWPVVVIGLGVVVLVKALQERRAAPPPERSSGAGRAGRSYGLSRSAR